MTTKRRLFAGDRLRALRESRRLNQAEMASHLGISVSYLSQLEHNDRPVTATVLAALAQHFPLDWNAFEKDFSAYRFGLLRNVAADPLFKATLSTEQLTRIAEQHPILVDQFIALHGAYRQAGHRLQIVDEALSNETVQGGRLPWEEVRDWFHNAGNYIDSIDRAAEALANSLCSTQSSPEMAAIEHYLRHALDVTVTTAPTPSLRAFDGRARTLRIHSGQAIESQRFQLAYQLVALSLKDAIDDIVATSKLTSSGATQLLAVGLTNYAAGAFLMPYAKFRDAARSVRHDIDHLTQIFSVSFEQACHRLSTLQRAGLRGVPFFFCRVDMAGNITKRHSATRLQFARFGGACPLWIVHEAVAIPDRILVQLAETPDGVRYVSMAKGLVKPSGRYHRAPRRYAVALGCEAEHAKDFIYADGLDVKSADAVAHIGVSCRLCPRPDCDQRAYPPNDRDIDVDQSRRDVVPYSVRI